MISKITSSNSELFYQPAFDLINKAIVEQAAKRPEIAAQAYTEDGELVQIKTIEDYFSRLTTLIMPLWVNMKETQSGLDGEAAGYLLLMPADEEIFEINANTREIIVPAKIKKNGIGVYGDHFAEMIVFQIDRYFDNQDLINTKCAINWNFTIAGERQPIQENAFAAAAFVPNADINPDKVTFGFIIDKTMTPAKGVLTFSVSFYTESAGNINYRLNTLTANVNINDTLSLEDPTIIRDETANFLGRLTNSVYTDSTMTPLSAPAWRSGEMDEEGNYLGLPAIAYLPALADKMNRYEDADGYRTMLKALAVINPSTADVYYRWVFCPADAPIQENANNNIIKAAGRNTQTITSVNDYVDVPYDQMNELSKYWVLDGENRPMSSVTIGEDVYPLPITKATLDSLVSSEVITAAEVDEFAFKAVGSSFSALGAGTYQVFAQGYSGTGEFVEVPEGAELKVNIKYYKKALIDGEMKIDKAHPLMNEAAQEAKDNGDVLYVFNGGAKNSVEVGSNVCTIPGAIKPEVELSVQAESVFEFDPDTNIGTHDGNVRRLTGTDYDGYTYLLESNENSVITFNADVTINSDNNEDKAGQVAVQLIAANAADVTSIADLEAISSDLHFVPYPVASDGRFTSTPDLFYPVDENSDLDEIIAAYHIELPANATEEDKLAAIVAANEEPKFYVNSSLNPGDYVVRAFNRRNGTYSVSDKSNTVKLSYVAGTINNIDVKAIVNNSEITVLNGGKWPLANPENAESGQMVNIELPRRGEKIIDFAILDKSDKTKSEAISYFIEEVDVDDNGKVFVRDPDSDDNNDGQRDIRPIEDIEILNPGTENESVTGRLLFDVTNDPGFYRIRTVNVYHGTERTSFTDVFGVTSH